MATANYSDVRGNVRVTAALPPASGNHARKPRHRRGPKHKAKVAVEESEDEYAFYSGTGNDVLNDCGWIVDSGASSHMTWDRDVYCEYRELSTPQPVRLGDGCKIDATGKGIKLKVMSSSDREVTFTLTEALHVPEMSRNLLSVLSITDKGYRMSFHENWCSIDSKDGKVIAEAQKKGNLFQLQGEAVKTKFEECANVATAASREIWHSRLGHVGDATLEKLAAGHFVKGVTIKGDRKRSFCEGCARGKASHVKPQALNEICATRRCGIVHSDVLGPVIIESLTGKRFMISFTDDMMRCSQVNFMNSKAEALDKFKEYQASVEGTSGELIRVLHTNRGGEYMSREFKGYLVHQKIEHEETCAHSPEQNGVAERLNRTLMEKARPMVAHAGVGKAFWAEAVHTANYLKNRPPQKLSD